MNGYNNNAFYAYQKGFRKGYIRGRVAGERDAIDKMLEIINDVRLDVNRGYMFDMVDMIETRVKELNRGNQNGDSSDN